MYLIKDPYHATLRNLRDYINGKYSCNLGDNLNYMQWYQYNEVAHVLQAREDDLLSQGAIPAIVHRPGNY